MFRRKKNKELIENRVQGKVAGKIAGFFISVQKKFADAMNKVTSGIPGNRMRVLLVLFCLFWGGLSFYFIADAVFGSKQISIKVDQVKVLRHIDQPGDAVIEDRVSFETYQQIQDYKRCMDSIHAEIRPGLLDSMQILEQIYLSQQKNEADEK